LSVIFLSIDRLEREAEGDTEGGAATAMVRRRRRKATKK
jgi:hypothetical protein